MRSDDYRADSPALLVIDPYNDFISEGGKIWPRISAVAEANHCVQHILEVLHGRHGCAPSTRCTVGIVRGFSLKHDKRNQLDEGIDANVAVGQ